MKSAFPLRRVARLALWFALACGSSASAQESKRPEAAPATAPVAAAPASKPAIEAAPAPAKAPPVAEPAVPGLGPAAPRPADDFSASSWGGAQPADDLGYGWVLLRTIVVLGLVLALIYLTLNIGLRRLMGIKGLPGGRTSVVALLERVPLDQKRALFVVKAAGEYLLIGGGDGSLSLIAKLDPGEVEKLQREKPASPLALSPFLQKLLTRRGGPPPPTA